MKFWLLVFVLTPQGDFLWSDVYETPNKKVCIEQSAKVAKTFVNTNNAIQMYCVSDDHYQGRKFDKDIPLDFN